MRDKGPISFTRGAALAAAVGLIAVGAGIPAWGQAPQGGRGSGADRAATINTYKAWDGQLESAGFGCGGATNSGQVITVPEGMTSLDKYAFLYESAPQSFPDGGPTWEKETYRTGGVSVTPGAQYLIFNTIDKDYEQCNGVYGREFAAVPGDVYPDGAEYYLRSFGDESEWTTHKWHVDKAGYDLAVKVFLS